MSGPGRVRFKADLYKTELKQKEIHKALITPKFHRKDKKVILDFN